MLSLLASMLLSLPAMPSASVTCADGPASCGGAWVELDTAVTDDVESDGYATPAEVDCRMPAAIGQIFSDACDQSPPDLWYRVSREPDAGPAGTLSAARRQTASRATASCGGVPADPRAAWAPSDAQPVALVALPTFAAHTVAADSSPDTKHGPARHLVPLDRP